MLCSYRMVVVSLGLLLFAGPCRGHQQCVPACGPHVGYIDITATTATGLPIFGSPTGLPGYWRALAADAAAGSAYTESWLNLGAHSGTHVDAPRHFLPEGGTVEALDLGALIGPVLVVEVPGGSNITAGVLEALKLPSTAQRLIFKTTNTNRGLMSLSEFAPDYTAVDTSGAQWLVSRAPNVLCVGIDYLSIAIFEDVAQPHRTLFAQGVVVVEGLNLTGVAPGPYIQTCLPAKYGGSDGAPVRCILQAVLPDVHSS